MMRNDPSAMVVVTGKVRAFRPTQPEFAKPMWLHALSHHCNTSKSGSSTTRCFQYNFHSPDAHNLKHPLQVAADACAVDAVVLWWQRSSA